jgi:hypothetical protein
MPLGQNTPPEAIRLVEIQQERRDEEKEKNNEKPKNIINNGA